MAISIEILRQPPFTLGLGSPQQIGRQIADTYAVFDETPPKVADVWRAAHQALKLPEQSPIFQAGLELAETLDAGNGTGIEDGYHNTQHFIEVLLNATYLIQHHNTILGETVIDPIMAGKILFAALGHDYFYERGGYKEIPYRLENIALTHTVPLLINNGVAKQDISDICVMIYATDVNSPSDGGRFMRAVYHHHFEGENPPKVTRNLRRLEPLLKNKELTLGSSLLTDADVLSSLLTPEHSEKQSARFAKELGIPLSPKGILYLINIIMQERFTTKAASLFQPIMNEIKFDALQMIAIAIEPTTPVPPSRLWLQGVGNG
jgi:hypothetical protein